MGFVQEINSLTSEFVGVTSEFFVGKGSDVFVLYPLFVYVI